MIKKRFIKKQLFNFTIINILLLIIVANVSFAAINPANNGSDMFNRNMWHGYFYNEQQAWGGDCDGRVLCQGLGSPEKPVNNKADFINQIKSYWSTGSNKGADFIILTMIGKKPANLNAPMQLNPTANDVADWEKLVNDSNIILNDIILDVRWNTYTQNLSNGRHDIAWYDQHTTGTRLTNQPAISFSDSSGKIFYSIRKDCGNPVNAMPGTPPPPESPKGDLTTFSSVKIGDNNVIATEADNNQAYIDYKDLTNYISFRNYVKTSNVENAGGSRLTFKVTTSSSKVSLTDSNFSWGAHPYNIGPNQGFVVNPDVIYNGNTGWQNTLADSNSRLKLNNKVENLIGNKICRKVEVISSPNWLNKISTSSEACINILGSDVKIKVTFNDYEKGDPNDQKVNFYLQKDSKYCDSGSVDPVRRIKFYLNSILSDYPTSLNKDTVITMGNCDGGVTEDILINSVTLDKEELNKLSTGPHNIVTTLKKDSTSGPEVFSSSLPYTVYEAPFVIFNGNDVRACPTADFKNRFVYKPDSTNLGSRTWLASLWGDSATITVGTDHTSGWSKGLDSYNNNSIVNNIKAKGVDCGMPVSYTGASGEIRATSLGTSNQLAKTATDVYINGDITATAPTAPTSTPPKYEINATNVYINKGVKLLQGVIINATNVYTCSEGTAKVPNTEWHTECNNPLRIEGSINAQNLYLMRSVGTRYKSDGGGAQVGIPASGSRVIEDSLMQPAEVIVYPAYFYFTNVGASGAGSTKGSIDSYSQTAPRL